MKLADKIILDYLRQHQYNAIILPNCYTSFSYWEYDLLKIDNKTKYTTEIEVKVSRSDYSNDFNKSYKKWSIDPVPKIVNKHELIQSGQRTNKFYYLVPDNLIKAEEVPEKYGLIYYNKERRYFRVMKPARFLHKNKLTDEDFNNVMIKVYYKYITMIQRVKKERSKNEKANF